jgi:hypothetical protein
VGFRVQPESKGNRQILIEKQDIREKDVLFITEICAIHE